MMRHAVALRREGVRVEAGALGEMSVDLVVCGWFPEVLPSEEGDALGESGGEDGEEGR